MRLRPQDPMRTKATDSGVEDGWHGARIGAETRDRARRAETRIHTGIDIGEPGRATVTIAFLALTLAATIIEFATFGTSPTTSELSRSGGAGVGVVATGAWWKLLASNLLHANVLHVAMNAFVIYLTGRWLEHLAGRAIMVATILWSAIAAGVFGILVDTPSVSIGASGVAFGIVGCAIAIDPRARTATGLIARQLGVVNVVITFIAPGISIGGHLGGLAAGLAVGALAWSRTRRDDDHPVGRPRRAAAATLVAAWIPFAAIAVAGPSVLPGDLAHARGTLTASLLERQLSGATLSSGLKIDTASCTATSDLLVYDCDLDGRRGTVTFSTRDDQWSLATAR
ncbi:MAG: rhomboid family intramembrane serine protease [Thermoleophilia bacterium]|nr:rhomboid family intramembrane serine protease [Thermoleophilia bacterium]